MRQATEIHDLITRMTQDLGYVPSVRELRSVARCSAQTATMALREFRSQHPDMEPTRAARRRSAPRPRNVSETRNALDSAALPRRLETNRSNLDPVANRVIVAIEELAARFPIEQRDIDVIAGAVAHWVEAITLRALEEGCLRRSARAGAARTEQAAKAEMDAFRRLSKRLFRSEDANPSGESDHAQADTKIQSIDEGVHAAPNPAAGSSAKKNIEILQSPSRTQSRDAAKDSHQPSLFEIDGQPST